MKILVVASHSGGHILPAIAFCQGLKDRDNDTKISFVTTDGQIEKRLLNNNFNPIFFKRKKITILTSYSLLVLFFRAWTLLNRLKPNLVVGFGGYLSIPFILCAYLLRIPNFIHEQNMKMGTANRVLAKFSHRIIFSFPNTRISDKLKNKALILGNPLRKVIKRLSKEEAMRYFDFDINKFTILVTGGSQGSSRINTQFIRVLKGSKISDTQVIHLTGMLDYNRAKEEYKDWGIKYKIYPFFEQMQYAFSACDLVICRAGATMIAEIMALRIPSILIPYPYARLHQLDNADFLISKKAAVLIEDRFLSESILTEKIISLKNSPDKLKQISKALDTINISNAREQMVELAFNLAQ